MFVSFSCPGKLKFKSFKSVLVGHELPLPRDIVLCQNIGCQNAFFQTKIYALKTSCDFPRKNRNLIVRSYNNFSFLPCCQFPQKMYLYWSYNFQGKSSDFERFFEDYIKAEKVIRSRFLAFPMALWNQTSESSLSICKYSIEFGNLNEFEKYFLHTML